ncbi:hypothetical protein ABMA27_011438 [Loxostege sticticalis]|uniref:Uncharacterized protein n=1 Tax=Loxostege sticticalis TaxID=481309 RepID=A0ABR3IG97_LOXSC
MYLSTTLSRKYREKIRPLPKAPPRKTNANCRRKRKSAVLTDTPEKEALRMEYEEKIKKYVTIRHSKGDWVECIVCKMWAHVGCVTGDISFLCINCNSDVDKIL